MKRILYILPLALLWFGCTDEIDQPNNEGEIVNTSIIINSPNYAPKESSGNNTEKGDTYDNYIRTIDVLTFQNNEFYHRGMTGSAQTEQTKFDVTLLNNGKPQDLVILANARKYIDEAFPGGLLKGTSKETILSVLKAVLPEPVDGEEFEGWTTGKGEAVSAYNPVPMWKEVLGHTVSAANSIKVSLVRMLAKVQVINTLPTDKFKLSSVMLGNYRTQGRIVPDAYEALSPIGERATVRSVNRTVYTETATSCEAIELYTFETDASADEESAPYIIIGGKYENATTDSYYRLSLVHKEGDAQNLLRNHLYKVKINSVKGPGSTDPDEISLGMKVSIEDWESIDRDITIESEQDWLQLSHTKFSLYNNINQTVELKATGSAQAGISVTSQYSWLKVTQQTEDTWIINVERVKTDLAKIGFENRTAILNVKLKNLTYAINVVQDKMLNSSNSWFVLPGGSVNIPLNKVYMIYENINNDDTVWEDENKKISYSLVWEDVKGLIDQRSFITIKGEDGKRINSQLQVKGNAGKKGNAVVAAHIGPKGDSSDPICWSWHLWVTDYDPGVDTEIDVALVGEFKLANKSGSLWQYPSSAHIYMDRNLGAMDVRTDIEGGTPTLTSELFDSYGLHYQWGRKDPFPGAASSDKSNRSFRDIFDSNGNVISELSMVSLETDKTKLIQEGIHNPQLVIKNWLDKAYYDLTYWKETYSYLWKYYVTKKAIYDPCPKGWKMPDDFGTAGFIRHLDDDGIEMTNIGRYAPNLGFFPSAGYRNTDNNYMHDIGTGGYKWQVSLSLNMYNWRIGECLRLSTKGVRSWSDISNTMAMVRCERAGNKE